MLGYTKALAVDGGILALTYSVQQRKQQKRSTKMLWAGIILFAAISINGNYETAMNYVGVAKAVILSATLPVLVLFLAEVISENNRHNEKIASKKKPQTPILQPDIAKANDAKQDKIAQRRERVKQLNNEGLQPKEIALQVDVKDIRTIKNDLQAIEVSLNGGGVVITASYSGSMVAANGRSGVCYQCPASRRATSTCSSGKTYLERLFLPSVIEFLAGFIQSELDFFNTMNSAQPQCMVKA